MKMKFSVDKIYYNFSQENSKITNMKNFHRRQGHFNCILHLSLHVLNKLLCILIGYAPEYTKQFKVQWSVAIMWVKVSMILEHGIGDACYSNGVTPQNYVVPVDTECASHSGLFLQTFCPYKSAVGFIYMYIVQS